MGEGVLELAKERDQAREQEESDANAEDRLDEQVVTRTGTAMRSPIAHSAIRCPTQ
jgi:hypothetical protein